MSTRDIAPGAGDGGNRTQVSELRVLIVEDDEDSLAALRASLQDASIRVVGSTDNGEHALDLARILDPDIALIKWNMRRFGGALTARLMQWHAPRVTPVLLVEEQDVEEVAETVPQITPTITSISRNAPPSELRANLRSIGQLEDTAATHTARRRRRESRGDPLVSAV
jgi:DNA-binding NarL/FixJ family response regulator